MRAHAPSLVKLYATLTVAGLSIAAALAIGYAPVDAAMGPVQKLIYLHLPAALAAFFCAFVVFVDSIAYLWSRDDRWDESARITAFCAVFASAVVLVTGMVWGHFFWGYWWTWSPRLTFTLVLFALYLGYLVMRALIADRNRRRLACAVYGLVAFLDVPLLYLSTRLLPDVHPTSIPLTGAMRLTLLACLVPLAMALIGLAAGPWFGFGAHERPGSRAAPGIRPGPPRVA